MRFLFSIFVILFSLSTLGFDRVQVKSEGVVVYSGPNTKFRPIRIAKVGDLFPVAAKRVQGNDGEYYVVVIREKNEKKGRTGYILVSPATEIIPSSEADESIEFNNAKSTYSTAIHVGLYSIPKDQFLWTAAYQHYLGAGLFYRGIIGEYLTDQFGSTLVAGEIGNEQGLGRDISLSTFLAVGGLVSPKADLVFDGSKTLSYYLHGGFGIRYDADEYSAVGLMIMQIAFLNQNNSRLNLAVGMTLEVGI